MAKVHGKTMEEPDLARLLSGRNRPSVLEKEAAFEQVMARMPKRPSRWLRGVGLSTAGALAAALMVWLSSSRHATELGELAARGAATTVPNSFELVCGLRKAAGHCVQGDKLGFVVHAPADRFFAAFARRSDGTVLWYWPALAGKSIPASALAALNASSDAVLLDSAHVAGRYTIFGVFSTRPLGREAIQSALGADLSGRVGIEVVQRALSVEAP